jgi:hypothetical protein
LTGPSGREDLHPKKSEVQAKTADKRKGKKKEEKKKKKKRKKEKKRESSERKIRERELPVKGPKKLEDRQKSSGPASKLGVVR